VKDDVEAKKKFWAERMQAKVSKLAVDFKPRVSTM